MKKYNLSEVREILKQKGLNWEEHGHMFFAECHCCGSFVRKEYVRNLSIFEFNYENICCECSYEIFSITNNSDNLKLKYA